MPRRKQPKPSNVHTNAALEPVAFANELYRYLRHACRDLTDLEAPREARAWDAAWNAAHPIGARRPPEADAVHTAGCAWAHAMLRSGIRLGVAIERFRQELVGPELPCPHCSPHRYLRPDMACEVCGGERVVPTIVEPDLPAGLKATLLLVRERLAASGELEREAAPAD